MHFSSNRELKKLHNQTVDNVNIENYTICETNDTENDEVIAHMLQDQFNKEHDLILKRTEKILNRDSKGKIFFLINLI